MPIHDECKYYDLYSRVLHREYERIILSCVANISDELFATRQLTIMLMD